MSTYTPKRHARGEWMRDWLATNASIRTVGDVVAFFLCSACVVALLGMALYVAGFFA